MIQLVILFLFVVFVIAVILLYKKYIKIKNVVDEEQNKKYSKVREAVGSNNERIKDMKEDAKDILNDEGNNVSSLESRVNANKEQIASNRNTIIDNNFETINSVFKYDSGLVIGGTAGHMRMGDDNIRLNVQNPTQVRVCDANKNCTNIITRKMVQDTWPTQISSGPGVSTTTTSPVDGEGGGNGGNVVVSNDGNLEFNNETKIFSSSKNIKTIQFNTLWGKSDISEVVPNTYLFDMAKIYNPQYNLITSWQYMGPMVFLAEGESVSGNLFPLNQNVIDASSQEKITIGFVEDDGISLEIRYNINISNGEVITIT